MDLHAVKALIDTKPTCMGAEDELEVIENLMKVDEHELINGLNDFLYIVDNLCSSHMDTGYFDVNYDNEKYFFAFSDWLARLGRQFNIKGLEEYSGVFSVSFDEVKKEYGEPKR